MVEPVPPEVVPPELHRPEQVHQRGHRDIIVPTVQEEQ